MIQIILGMVFGVSAQAITYTGHTPGMKDKACISSAKLNLNSSNKLSDYKYLCYGLKKDEGKSFYCESENKEMNCGSVKLQKSSEMWSKALDKSSSSKEKKVLKTLKSSKDYKSLLLAASLDLMKLKKPLSVNENFRVLTGKYSRFVLNNKPLKVKCLEEILYAAQIFQKEFQDFNFQIDNNITQCKNLREGAALMLKNKKDVAKNLKHVSSPLHTIYFTNKTKFNEDTLGEMGLYVNVNKKNEIKKRILDLEAVL